MFAEWERFSGEEKERLTHELLALVGERELERFRSRVLGVGKPEAAAPTVPKAEPTVPKAEPTVSKAEAQFRFLEPPALHLTSDTSAEVLQAYEQRGRELLPRTVFVLAAAGGGTRLERSVPAALKEKLRGANCLTKPTFPVGPVSGKSPLIYTLESLSRLGSSQESLVPFVLVVVSEDTRAAVTEAIARHPGCTVGLELHIIDQSLNPTFDEHGSVLTTVNPKTLCRQLHTSASGTLGVLKALARPFAEDGKTPLEHATDLGKDRFFFLYADDALLNSEVNLCLLLGAGDEADMLLVGVEKDGLLIPPGGTLCLRQALDDAGNPLPGDAGGLHVCIIELGDRTLALDQAEQELKRSSGRYFPLNAGPILAAAQIVKHAALKWDAPIHVTSREVTVSRFEGGQVAEQVVRGRKVEQYLPDLLALSTQAKLNIRVASVERNCYGAIKDYPKARHVAARIAQRSRQQLRDAGVEVAETAVVELGASFDAPIGADCEVDGQVHLELNCRGTIGRGVRFLGQGTTRLLGSVRVEDGVAFSGRGDIVVSGEGTSPLVLGAGARLHAAGGHGELREVTVVSANVAPGLQMNTSSLSLLVDAVPCTERVNLERFLTDFHAKPVILTHVAAESMTRWLIIVGSPDFMEGFLSIAAPERSTLLWSLHQTDRSVYDSLLPQIQRPDWPPDVEECVATLEVWDAARSAALCGRRAESLRYDEMLVELAGFLADFPGARDRGELPAVLCRCIAALHSEAYTSVVEHFRGDAQKARAWLLKVAQREGRSFADLLLEEFVPPSEVVSTRLCQELSPGKMVRSFSGIRAEYGESVAISFEHRVVAAVDAFAYGKLLSSKRPAPSVLRIVTAHDPRPTSEAILDAQVRGLIAGLKAKGRTAEIHNLGILPTPLLQQAVRTFDAHGGIMITASHCPIYDNGSKYTTGAVEPEGAPLCGGALLTCQEMEGLLADSHELLQRVCAGDREALDAINAVPLGQVAAATHVDPESRREVFEGFATFTLKQLQMEEGELEQYRSQVQGHTVVLDPNGGAAVNFGQELFRYFGFDVVEINNELGTPNHVIEPSGEAFEDVAAVMAKSCAVVGGVSDWDADRLNWATLDQTGGVTTAGPQEVAAFNVALWLSWLDLRGKLNGRPIAIVAHDPTSGMVDDIARAFGATVLRVETGETNLVAKITELGRQGWVAPIGVEGANGGTIFANDTCRNGLFTMLFAATVAAMPAIVVHWLGKSGQWEALSPEEQRRFADGNYTLGEVVSTLPRWCTVASKIPGVRVLSHLGQHWQGLLKEAFEKRFAADFWPTRDPKYVAYRFLNYQGTEEVVERTGTQSGGFKVELTDHDGRVSFVWFRFSKTEPNQCRMICDSRSQRESTSLLTRGIELFRLAQQDVAGE